MKNIKNKRGITLIALVITIIVLLILASITLSLTFGENGLLKRTQDATQKMKEEIAKEEVRLAWAAIKMDYSKDSLNNKEVKKKDYFTKDKLNKELKGQGEIIEFEYVENGTTTLTYVKPNKEKEEEKYYMEIETNDKIILINKVPLEEGTVEFSIIEWKDKKASIQMSTTSGHKIQYQIGSKDGEWINGNIVNELNLDDIVFARLYEGQNGGKIFKKKIVDEDEPNDAVISFSTTSTNTISTIKATIEQKDEQSGVSIEKCKWEYSTVAEAIGTDPNVYTGGVFTSENEEIDLKATTEGVYYLHVLTVDNAGNAKETISHVSVHVEVATLPGNPDTTTGIFRENSTINGEEGDATNPEIPKGFKPVDVGEAKWGTQEGYKKGLVIQDNIGNQFVWVPIDGSTIVLNRYRYGVQGDFSENRDGAALGDTIYINYYQELKTSTYGNVCAKDIDGFKSSVTTHKGFYIGRFEGRQDLSTGKLRTIDWNGGGDPRLWSQVDAANSCRNMYDASYGCISDLVNSYAWDTCLKYLNTYSGNSTYAWWGKKESSSRWSKQSSSGDVACNIYNMSSFKREWTTETYIYSGYGGVARGNLSNGSSTNFAGWRKYGKANDVRCWRCSTASYTIFKISNLYNYNKTTNYLKVCCFVSAN